MPTHEQDVKNRKKQRKDAAKGCQNFTSFFFATTTRLLVRSFSFSFSFCPNLLFSYYLKLILFCLYFVSGIKNLIKIKLAINYIRQYSFVKSHNTDKLRVDNFASYEVGSCGEFTSKSLLNLPG